MLCTFWKLSTFTGFESLSMKCERVGVVFNFGEKFFFFELHVFKVEKLTIFIQSGWC